VNNQHQINNQHRYQNQPQGMGYQQGGRQQGGYQQHTHGRAQPQQAPSRPIQPSQSSNGHGEMHQRIAQQPSSESNSGKSHSNKSHEPRLEHVGYGKNAAFQFSSGRGKGQDGFSTVFIESAKRLSPNDPNSREYNWKAKIIVQVMPSELPIVIAVLLGFLPSCEFKNHGQDNKWFAIENQGKNYCMKMGASQKELNVAPITLVDALQFGTIALVSYTKNYPGLTSDAALTTIRMMAKQMYDNGAFPASQQQAQRRQQ